MTPALQRQVDLAGLAALDRSIRERPVFWLWLVLGLALTARAAVALALTNIDPSTANIWEYGRIARLSLEYGRMVFEAPIPHTAGPSMYVFPTAYMPPFLIFVWMGLFWLFGVSKLALATMTALNVLMGVGIVYYTMRIARTLFGSELLAVITGLVMALHPVFVYSVVTYQALNLYILMLLVVFDLTRAERPQTFWLSVLVGLLTGIVVLVRTEYLVLAGAISLGALITHRRWKMTLVAALTALAVLAPWTVRNYAVMHRLIPVANSAGHNLYKGFNPEANGSGNWVDDHRIIQKRLGDKIARIPLTPNYENDLDDIERAAALEFIKEHPFRSFVVLPMLKIALFWFYDVTDPITHMLLYQIQFWPLFITSIIGLAAAARAGYFSKPDHRTVLILFAFQTLVMAAYAVHSRYRMNVEPFLYAYASFGGLVLLAWLRSKLARTTAPEAV